MQARLQARRERAQARRAGGLEMVNIVVNRCSQFTPLTKYLNI